MNKTERILIDTDDGGHTYYLRDYYWTEERANRLGWDKPAYLKVTPEFKTRYDDLCKQWESMQDILRELWGVQVVSERGRNYDIDLPEYERVEKVKAK